MKEISDCIVDLDEFNMVEEFGEGRVRVSYSLRQQGRITICSEVHEEEI